MTVMQSAGITRADILKTMDDHKRVGRDPLQATYGSRTATGHVVLYEKYRFVPEAIIEDVHRRTLEQASLPSVSHGGTDVAKILRNHNFAVLTFAEDFVRRVGEVRPARHNGGPRLHRPLLLLTAIAQAMSGTPRLQLWSDIRDELAPLLVKYAQADDGADAARYPFWALIGDNLWIVPRAHELELTSGRRRPTLTSLNEVNPSGGLLERDYETIRLKPEVAAEAAAGLLLRYFHNVAADLIKDLNLTPLLEGRWADALRPLPGETFKNREAIWHRYGGQRYGGIGPLGDSLLSAFADDKSTYADGRMPDTGWIAYVGDGLSGDQTLTGGNLLMAEHQTGKQALRYWHRPFELPFSFETWVVIVQRRKRWGKGEDGAWRREFVWILAPVPSPDRLTWPPDVVEALKDDDGVLHDETSDYQPSDIDPSVPPPTKESEADLYGRLNRIAEKQAEARKSAKKPSKVDRYLRSQSARAAVIRRSKGNCESPECSGHPRERTATGAPILEVDHVKDLAKGGLDVPRNMIALCPNCHALKTRGANRERLGRVLARTAERLHAAAAAPAAPAP